MSRNSINSTDVTDSVMIGIIQFPSSISSLTLSLSLCSSSTILSHLTLSPTLISPQILSQSTINGAHSIRSSPRTETIILTAILASERCHHRLVADRPGVTNGIRAVPIPGIVGTVYLNPRQQQYLTEATRQSTTSNRGN